MGGYRLVEFRLFSGTRWSDAKPHLTALVIGPHRKNDGAGGHGADALVGSEGAVRVAAATEQRSWPP
jgi:hypothetical protein